MLSIIVGSIVMFAIGAVWFTVLFGKIWSKLMNFTPEQNEMSKKAGMASKMVVMFVLNVIATWVLYYILSQVIVFSYGEFFVVMLIVWLGFTLPSLVNTYLWEGKSLKLVAINAGGSLAAFIGSSMALYFLK